MNEWSLPTNVQMKSIESAGTFLWDTGVYDVTVKLAYLDQSDTEAVNLNIILERTDKKELKESFCIKSGKNKGNKTYYTKDGINYPLPGYATANSLCIAACNKSLVDCLTNLTQKQVKVYDFDTKTDVIKTRPVLVDLLNTQCKVALLRVKKQKQKKNSQGNYEDTNETREFNESKFFANMAGFSAEELEKKATTAETLAKWAEVNQGKTLDKTSKTSGSSAADIMNSTGTTATTNSLFGN